MQADGAGFSSIGPLQALMPDQALFKRGREGVICSHLHKSGVVSINSSTRAMLQRTGRIRTHKYRIIQVTIGKLDLRYVKVRLFPPQSGNIRITFEKVAEAWSSFIGLKPNCTACPTVQVLASPCPASFVCSTARLVFVSGFNNNQEPTPLH